MFIKQPYLKKSCKVDLYLMKIFLLH